MSHEMKKLMEAMSGDNPLGIVTESAGQYPYLEALKAAAQGTQWADREPRWMACWYAAMSILESSDTRDIARDLYDGNMVQLSDDEMTEAWLADLDDEEPEDDVDGDGGLAAFARNIIQAIS